MKTIAKVIEFESKGVPVKELISDTEVEDKEYILNYLKTKEPIAAAAGKVSDEITDEDTDITIVAYEADGFYWDSRYIYHFEKYNLQLEPEFLSIVRAQKDRIILLKYEELSPGFGYESLKGNISDEPYEYKDEMLKYMKTHGKTTLASGLLQDKISGEVPQIKGQCLKNILKTDGVAGWSTAIEYYIENYNLRLPKEGEEYFIKNIKEEKEN